MATNSAQHETETETAPFTCRKCERVFAYRCMYDRHIKNLFPCVRQGASRYSCEACNAGFDLKTRYDQHLRTKKHLKRVQVMESEECDAEEEEEEAAAQASPTLPESIRVEGMRSGIRLSPGGMLSGHDLIMQACDVTEDAASKLLVNMCTTVTLHVGPLSGGDDQFLVDALGAALIMRVLGMAGQAFRDEFGERLLIAMGADDITRASLQEPVDYFDDDTEIDTKDDSATVPVNTKFVHDSEAICSSLGYGRKDVLVKVLKRDYQENVDWISQKRWGSVGRALQIYYLTDECLRMLVYRCSSRCVTRSVTPVRLGDNELHHIRRYHPKEEELIGFLMRVFSRKHSCHVQRCLGPYRVDMMIDDCVVVECDEHNHVGYDQVKEADRHEYIKMKGYTLYGFDCDCPTFDLATVVADLNDLL